MTDEASRCGSRAAFVGDRAGSCWLAAAAPQRHTRSTPHRWHRLARPVTPLADHGGVAAAERSFDVCSACCCSASHRRVKRSAVTAPRRRALSKVTVSLLLLLTRPHCTNGGRHTTQRDTNRWRGRAGSVFKNTKCMESVDCRSLILLVQSVHVFQSLSDGCGQILVDREIHFLLDLCVTRGERDGRIGAENGSGSSSGHGGSRSGRGGWVERRGCTHRQSDGRGRRRVVAGDPHLLMRRRRTRGGCECWRR